MFSLGTFSKKVPHPLILRQAQYAQGKKIGQKRTRWARPE